MKSKLAILTILLAFLFTFSLSVRAQDTPQSIDEQIKQKEADLQRLKEIKARLEKIQQLQDEVTRLKRGEDVSNSPSNPPADSRQAVPPPVSSGQPAANPGGSGTPAPTQPTTPGAPSTASPPIASAAATDPSLPTLRSCAVVKTLSAQQTSTFEKYFCNEVEEIQTQKHGTSGAHPIPANPQAGFDLVHRDFLTFMIALLAREGRSQYIVAAENERVDKEVGSDASSSGSTSLVSKGSVPSILGFALNTGGLLKSNNGSTVTFRGNVAGLAKALVAKGFISGYDEDSAAARFLRKTSFSFSFDPNRATQLSTLAGAKQGISNYSVRMDLYNKRDPRESRYRDDWTSFLAQESQALVVEIRDSQIALLDIRGNTFLDQDPALKSWYTLAEIAMRNASEADVEAVFRDQINKIPKNLAPVTLARLRSFDKRLKPWLDKREQILNKIAKAPIITFEYVADRPVNATSLSRFNFIAEGGFGPRLDLTFNGALTLFNKRPTVAGQGRVRDFQFAGQFDMPFGEIGLGLGKPVLSFAGRYERLMSNATTAAGTFAPNTRGDIGVGQVKLTIPIKNSGIRIPISFSFANRTELLKEKEKRGNFGFTFDPDTLFALFKPFSK